MNIWFISAHDHPKSQTSRMLNFSKVLIKKGHQVTILTSSYDHRKHVELLDNNEKSRVEYFDGIKVVWLKTIQYTGNGLSRGLNMVSYAWQINRFASTLNDKPDIIIGDNVPPVACWVASVIASKKKAAFVYQIRDVWPIALVYDGALSRKSPIYFVFRMIEKYLYRKCHHVCSTVPYLKDHVAESGGNQDRVSWVPNGVDLDNYNGYCAYDGGEEPFVAMYVGAFGQAHDVITIIRAAGILQNKGNKQYRFVLIGDGVKKQECEDEAKRLGLTNVEFKDSVEKDQVPELQSKSDILIACVTDSDAYKFGLNLNKLYDYFASGRPVIFSGRAPDDPVKVSGAGFSIPPEDPEKMAEVLIRYGEMSFADRIKMAGMARSYAENNFDVKKLALNMERLLLQAIEDKSNS